MITSASHLCSESRTFGTTQKCDGCGVKTQDVSFLFLGTGRRGVRELLSGVVAAVVRGFLVPGFSSCSQRKHGILSGQGSGSTRGLEGQHTTKALFLEPQGKART